MGQSFFVKLIHGLKIRIIGCMFSRINFVRMPHKGWTRDVLHTNCVTLVDIINSSQMGGFIEDDVIDDGLQLFTLVKKHL